MKERVEESSDALHPAAPSSLPPIADVISREIRRMGRAWKIEGAKSLLHIVMTLLLTTVLGPGWLIFLTVGVAMGWFVWSRFRVTATVKPYKFLKRQAAGSEEADTGRSAEREYAEWLVRSEGSSDMQEGRA